MEPINIVTELTECINAIFDSLPKLPPVGGVLGLSKTPISLKRTHRYSRIFLSKPIDLLVDICGIGKFLLSLPIGWNDLSLPEETTISLASDDRLSALYRCTDI